MGISNDMEKIGEDILTSYDMRIRSIGELTSDVHKTLKSFEKDRMTDFETLMSNVKESIAEIKTRQGQRNREVRTLMQEFKAERKKMTADLKKMSSNWQMFSETMYRKRKGSMSRGRD